MQQQYADLAELAGSFIHEVKNHLSNLGLHLQLLEEDFQEAQTQRDRRALSRVQLLRGDLQRLVEKANDFLRFAQVKDLDLVPADLAEVIDELIDFFGPNAKVHGIEIKCYVPAGLPPVGLDRDLFKQALLNLLINAQQAMEPQGGDLTVQATAGPGQVCLSLIDTGKGMTPEVLARAFKPFFSARPGGTGLGLPTVRKIVEAHGGSISVESEPGRGTKFTIRLPSLPDGKATE